MILGEFRIKAIDFNYSALRGEKDIDSIEYIMVVYANDSELSEHVYEKKLFL